jgi:hypothetical protein
MRKIIEGTSEWFKERKQMIVSHARALDCIAAARRSVTAMLRNWESPDPEIRAALHSAAIISYARPFSDNHDTCGRWSIYPERYLKHEGFDRALHRHLLVLRTKIIAHHDSEYLSAKLLLARVTLSIGVDAPVGISVHVQSLYSIEDQEIARKYAVHFDAAIECIDAAMESDLRAYLQAGYQYPAVFKAVMEEGSTERVGEFSVTGGQTYSVPLAHNTKLGQLPVPKLSVGSDGYSYLITNHNVMVEGGFPVEGAGGSGVINLKPRRKTE